MKKDSNAKEAKSPTPTPAGQTLRDRLNQLNSTRQGNGKTGARNKNATAGIPKNFQKTLLGTCLKRLVKASVLGKNMKPELLICGSSNINYSKGYIMLSLEDFPIPETLEVEGLTLLRKTRFHVSLLCVKNIIENNSVDEQVILNHFCDFIKDNEIKFEGFTKEFRLVKDAERKSVVALCRVSNVDKFIDHLSAKTKTEISHQPTHVTIYTLQLNEGIGLNSQVEMEQKSKPLEVPRVVEDNVLLL